MSNQMEKTAILFLMELCSWNGNIQWMFIIVSFTITQTENNPNAQQQEKNKVYDVFIQWKSLDNERKQITTLNNMNTTDVILDKF